MIWALDRDVEGADRLVADDQLGIERQRAGDADALALPARELVRVALGVLDAETDRLEQLEDPPLLLVLGADAVDAQRLADDVPDAHARVERGIRVLEDDLHVAAQALHLGARGAHDVDALEGDLAGGRLDQAQHAAPGGRLAAPALADEPQRLALVDVEGDAVDRVDVAGRALQHTALDGEVLLEVADLEQAHATALLEVREGGADLVALGARDPAVHAVTLVRGARAPATASRHSGRS